MYARLQRQNSFGPRESKSTLVISRIMELKILEGESSIPNASPIVLESINNSLQALIDSCDSTGPVICEMPDFLKNVTISQCNLSEKEVIDKRYFEYFEGYSLANNVQYIPVEIECLSNMSTDLCKSILALFVSIVFEYISEDKNLRELELIKWGSTFLQRIGIFLGLSEFDIASIIKPVSENLELKQLGMNFDDLKLEKQIHIDYIKEQLAPMQEKINEFFKQTLGTFSDGEDENGVDNFDAFKGSDKTSVHSEKTSVSYDKTSGYMERSAPSYVNEASQYGQQYDTSEHKQYTEKDFDLLLDDEDDDGEVDDDEECFKRNFIETYNKDGTYKYDGGKSKSSITSMIKPKDQFLNLGEQFDEFTGPSNKYANLFDELTEPSYNAESSTDQQNGPSKYSDVFDEFPDPSYKGAEHVMDQYSNQGLDVGPNDLFNTVGGSFSKPDEASVKVPSGTEEYGFYKPSEYNEGYYQVDSREYKKEDYHQEYEFNEPSETVPRGDVAYDDPVSSYVSIDNQVSGAVSVGAGECGYNQGHEAAVSAEPIGCTDEYVETKEHFESTEDKSKIDLTNLLNNFLTNDASLGTFNTEEHVTSPVVSDLENVDTSGVNRLLSVSDSGTDDWNTNLEDEDREKEEDDLLRDLEKSMLHRTSMPLNDDFDSLLYDMSNMNLPPKKNKSLLSKIGSNITKKINRVFSINSDRTSRTTPTHSINTGSSTYPHHDYLNDLTLIEKSPDIVAVLVRNLVLKYIINGYNDSRGQAIFGLFSNLLGVTSGSLLSIENNMVSDLVGIMDMNAAKTTTKKMTKRLKILSATVGGTALLALTAGVASPVLAVGVVFLGLSGTGVSTYLSSGEGKNILKNMFGLNVSLTQFKAKRDLISNLQFIQLNPSGARESARDHDPSRFLLKDSSRLDSPRDKDDSNSNYIGICICVGNNIFLNEIFFFENNSVDMRSTETNRHLDSEYIDVWKQQFPVPINDLYLLKWESKLLASLHRMLLKLRALSIYDKCRELYRTYNNTVYTTYADNTHHELDEEDPLSFDVRDSSGGNKYLNVEGSSGNYYSGSADVPSAAGDGSQPSGDHTREAHRWPRRDSRTINWPVGLVQLCSNLDNCWLVCRNRAETCGALLANAICDKMLTGDRHISLVGYSMGARAIFYCLLNLFERNKINTVKDVVLMGLPSTAGHEEWSKCSSVVAGRLINVYNENDWVLAFLYRYTSNYNVAGLAPVVHERVENYNATNLFTSHVDYLENVAKITAHLNIQL
ncbi:hypothetical protein MACJ_002105 [Theileria orientalis]|uniref:Uncharacterized protein n=1 Tax=Theileria orientalis TaxID=68886 RepID=A0A976M5I1_THEOR|nr:hypothetical protein MACJ_002105 [Theileria orientalis]